MRKILFATVAVAALVFLTAAPQQANASWLGEYLHQRLDPGYGYSYYSPAYDYYVPSYNYGPGYYVAPAYDYYPAPSYSYYSAPYYAPYYYGPRYRGGHEQHERLEHHGGHEGHEHHHR
jgi:hypothetical protein